MNRLIIALIFLVPSLSCFSFNNTDSATYYLKQAKEYWRNNKTFDADKSYQKALLFDLTSADAHLQYADFLLGQRKHFQAIEQYGKVLEGNINNISALQKITLVSFQLRRWNDVVMYGNKMLQNGTFSDIRYMIGKSYFELENYGQSHKFLEEALAESPCHIETVTLLGKVFIELGNYKQAVAMYSQGLSLDADNNQLVYELGLLYYSLNDEKTAVKYFELAVDKGYKADLDYFENLGLAYLDNDLIKGVQTLNKVLEKKPNNAEILFQIARAYYKVEKFKEAATTYYQVYQNDPSNSRALYMTGVAFQKKGDKEKGIKLCEEAIRMDGSLAQLKSQKFAF